MYSTEVTYIDYNNRERTETLYFNISKLEGMELQFGNDEGLAEYLKKIVKLSDPGKIISAFKEIILFAYGEKSDDGRRFEKSEEISQAFEESPAYETFMMNLLTSENKMNEFVDKVVPKFTEKELKEFERMANEQENSEKTNVTNFSSN